MYQHTDLVHNSFPSEETEHNHIGTQMAGDVLYPPGGFPKEDVEAGKKIQENNLSSISKLKPGELVDTNVVAGPGLRK